MYACMYVGMQYILHVIFKYATASVYIYIYNINVCMESKF